MPYRNFAELPLLRVILPFLAGILLFSHWDISAQYLWPLFLAGIICGVIMHIWVRFPNPVLMLFIFQFTVLLGAGALTRLSLLPEQRSHFSGLPAEYLVGHILKTPEEKEKSYKTIVRIDSLIDSTRHIRQASGKILLYLEKDSLYRKLQIGDKVVFSARFQEVEGPGNPGQFNYKKYLEHQYIYHQAYLRRGELVCAFPGDGYWLKRRSQILSIQLQSILKRYIPGHDEAALADGILLGHRADIEAELYNAFAYTGILHILSVSGLHVGIVYALLALLLKLIPDRNRYIRWGKFLVILTCIWMFALITGLGAAVVRAAILFSLLHYGRLTKEHAHNINLLCGAALIQLMIDPMQLYDIGFQLSYLAMLGIFLLSKRIYALYYHPNKLIDWTWQLWSASLAAQLFTLPLSLYYFGNFPTWFLFANIFAIPLSTLILWLSILLLPLSCFPVAATWLGKLTGLLGTIFIKLTLVFSNLPLGKVSGLKIDGLQVILVSTAIALFSVFLLRTRFKALIMAVLLSVLSVAVSVIDTAQIWRDEKIIVYAVPKQLVIGWKRKDVQVLLSRDSIPEKSYDFCIRGAQRQLHIRKNILLKWDDNLDSLRIRNSGHLLVIRGKSFYVLDKTNSRLKFNPPLSVDHLVLSGNLYLKVDELKQSYRFRNVLISPDNDNRHIRIYRKLLDDAKIPYIDLGRKAYVIEL